MIFTTSNEHKIKEIKRIFPEIKIVKGRDLKEVKGSSEEVATYKSLEAGKGFVVEDTILEIKKDKKFEELVEIKWLINDLPKYIGKKARWIVTLAHNDGEFITLYRGIIEGTIGNPYKVNGEIKGYGFDPYFYITFSQSLAKLDEQGRKDDFSARKKALLGMKKNKKYKKIKISDIPKWNGKYQNED